jgi:D-alanyl-lipoteichoic acid acyltransferase DltB (MBOAT superfamily)
VSEFGELFGVSTESLLLRVILPVGISFYTFQALSYSIDVYRGKIKPTKDIIAFFAFISFFPQLVAGPIERATNLLPQFLNRRTFSYDQATDGMRQILWGLFKKIVVADNCAVYVNQVWETYDTQSGSTLLLAAILFTFQIYGDFSGYSDIAIGTAKLFGIRLMRNFNNPYFSRDIAEFWRRWHISLTSWFRDYVYIPLGGSRPTIDDRWIDNRWIDGRGIDDRWTEGRKKLIIVRNVLIVFLICGLWHGANWTYLVWGLYNVLLFLPLILLGKSKRYKDAPLVWKQLPQMLLTFVLVTIGWIIFRAPSMAEAWGYVCAMCSASLFSQPATIQYPVWCAMAAIILMLSLEWHYRDAESVPLPKSIWAYYPLIIAIWWFAYRNTQEFIYFQF